VQFNTSMIPISWVVLTFEEGLTDQQKDDKFKEIKAELQRSEGAGQISIGGKSTPTIQVTPLTDKLASAGIPAQTLMGVLQGRGVTASLGEKNVDGSATNIVLNDQIADIETLRKLPIIPGVTLADVAKVDYANDQESINRLNGKDAIMFTISKSADANAVKAGNAIEEAVNRLNEDVEGIEISVVLSTAESVVSSVN
ncbi:efflux RND transporter permease subunit, partial [Paenibacillus sp. MCAF20]